MALYYSTEGTYDSFCFYFTEIEQKEDPSMLFYPSTVNTAMKMFVLSQLGFTVNVYNQ